MQRMLVLDGNSLLYRAFFALPGLTGPGGEPTGALTGFLNMLSRLVRENAPSHVAVAFDAHGPTFRHESYPEYKAGRQPTPDDLRAQFDTLRGLLPALGIAMLEQCGFEADDYLGCIARACDARGIECCVVTGDRDALQLISAHTKVLLAKNMGQMMAYTPEVFAAEYGIPHTSFVDAKALMGDSSDNIPGIPGIGPKTALKWLAEYTTLENLLAHAAAIPGKAGERLRAGADDAYRWRDIATIKCDIELPDFDDFAFAGFCAAGLVQVRQLGMVTAAAKLLPVAQGGPAEPEPEQEQAEQVDSLDALAAAMSGKRWAVWREGDELSACDGQRHVSLRLEQSAQLSLLGPRSDPAESLFDIAPDVHFLLWDVAQWARLPAGYDDVALMAYVADANTPMAHPAQALAQHATAPAARGLWQAYDRLQALLTRREALTLYTDTELPCAALLRRLHEVGIGLDAEQLAAYGRELATRIEQLRGQVIAACGCEFNLGSPKQLGEVLFDKLQLPAAKKTKSGWSTDAAVLEGLIDLHPCIAPLLEWRKLTKLYGTYIEGLRAALAPDGRVHTTFLQLQTATGRLSSADPNLQNIPVRTPEGALIRRAFVPKPGYTFVAGDYSQIELRILAHVSGDEAFCRAFVDGQDIHRATAAEVFAAPLDEVTPAQRSAAKAVNFGIVYGISDFGLARQLGIARGEAGEIITRYRDRYPGIRAFMQAAPEQAVADGGARTLFGRFRTIPELNSSQHNVREFGKRAAINTPIQGAAADIIKLAMVAVDRELGQHYPNAAMLLQVHDELLLEVPQDQAQGVAEMLKSVMENVAQLNVPLVVDVHCADNWGALK